MSASLLLAILFSLPALGAGMVQVSATVPDEGTGATVARTGKGTLVERDGKFYVYTAAHVAAGAPASLEAGGEKLVVKSRRSVPAEDYEVYEVQPPKNAKPLARWRHGRYELEGAPGSEGRFLNQERVRVAAADALLEREYYLPGQRLPATGEPDSAALPVLAEENGVRPASLPRPGAVFAHLETFDRHSYRLQLPVRIVPGQSGSPVFERVGEKWVLRGLAQSYDRSFPLSYVGGAAFVSERYPKSPAAPKARWRFRHGLAYLDYGNGLKEVATVEGPAGGDTNHGGGDTNHGGGDTNHGGSGERAAGDVYRELRIEPGVEIDGRAMIAVRAPNGSFVYADRSALHGIMRGELRRKGNLPTGSDLQPLILRRLEKELGTKIEPGLMVTGRANLALANGWNQLSELKVLPSGLKLRLPVGADPKDPTKIVWVELALDKKGGVGGKPFRPIVRAQGSDGRAYLVDLRFFYFEFDPKASKLSDPAGKLRSPSVRVMREDAPWDIGQSRHFTFNTPGTEADCADCTTR